MCDASATIDAIPLRVVGVSCDSRRMSETATAQRVPAWDLADRMRKSLREADIGVQEMADYLGVGRNTVSTWINGRITPGRPVLRLWSMRCGVSYEWLNGETEINTRWSGDPFPTITLRPVLMAA